MKIKSILPASLLSKAYEYNSEYAWKLEDILELALMLRQNKIAVLGGELWKRTEKGPFIDSDLYQWNAREQGNAREQDKNESWENYVDYTLKAMDDFIKNLPKEKILDKDLYLNVQMMNKG